RERFRRDVTLVLGEAPGLRGYFIAAGFNSGGIAYSGGAGRALAEWIVGGHMPMDLWSVDPRRFAAFHGDPRFLAERMREVPGLHYRMAWPLREHESGRGLLRSALHDRLAARGARLRPRLGWGPAHSFAGESVRAADHRVRPTDAGATECSVRPAAAGARPVNERARPPARYTFARPDWLPHVAREHRAARESAALFDQSSFAKFVVTGA